MDTTAYLALGRQMALERMMTSIAGNIANATTTGYQAETLRFTTVLERIGQSRSAAFVGDSGEARDTVGGPLAATGNPLDLAIQGKGYFPIQTANGVRLTRDGHFGLDADGQIATAAGDPLLDEGGSPISVPAGGGAISVAIDGTVSTRRGSLGRIQPVEVADEQAMRREGDGLFRAAQATRPATDARIEQGMLEGSNVKPILELARLMETQRAFEGTQKMIEAQHDLERRAIQTLAGAQS
jgi:flagellar basal-body rod protein FlgF